MKQETHPKYYSEAKVTCNGCGRTYTVGSTKESLTVELCSNCHPFYTGKQKLVDTAGRVDRYRARAAKAGQPKQKATPKPAPKAPSVESDSPTPEERLTKMKAELSDSPEPADDKKQ